MGSKAAIKKEELLFFKAEFLKEQKNMLIRDKLSPVFQHGFFRSEENVDLHNLSEVVWKMFIFTISNNVLLGVVVNWSNAMVL